MAVGEADSRGRREGRGGVTAGGSNHSGTPTTGARPTPSASSLSFSARAAALASHATSSAWAAAWATALTAARRAALSAIWAARAAWCASAADRRAADRSASSGGGWARGVRGRGGGGGEADNSFRDQVRAAGRWGGGGDASPPTTSTSPQPGGVEVGEQGVPAGAPAAAGSRHPRRPPSRAAIASRKWAPCAAAAARRAREASSGAGCVGEARGARGELLPLFLARKGAGRGSSHPTPHAHRLHVHMVRACLGLAHD